MKHIAIILALASLTGCKERLEEGAEIEKKRAVRKEGFVNVDGKLYPAAPAGITEAYCLVDGKQVPARLVRTKCENGKCVLYVVKDERSK